MAVLEDPNPNDAREALPPEQARLLALEALASAQDAISAKGLLELASMTTASPTAQVVAMAAACLVVGVDGAMEGAAAFRAAPSSWPAIQGLLSKPGPFLTALRRFSYASAEGRVAEQNVALARQSVTDVSLSDLASEQLVQHLYNWVRAALHFQSASALAPSEQAGPFAAARVPGTVGVAELSPPTSPAPASDVTRQDPSPAETRRPVRNSTGSTAGGRTSLGTISSPASTIRSPGRPSTGRQPLAPVGRTTAAPQPRTGGLAAVSAPQRPSTTSSSGAQRAAPRPVSSASGAPGRLGLAASGGYPRPAPKTRLEVEDMRKQLEQLKRETMEMKAMEGQLKWTLKREEERLKKTEKKEDTLDIIKWRQQQQNEAQTYAQQTHKQKLSAYLKDSKEFQEYKRDSKEASKEDTIKLAEVEYVETKEHARWRAEQAKAELALRQQLVVEEHIEQYRLVAEYNLEEQQRSHQAEREIRQSSQQQDMEEMLAKAKREKDIALRALEHLKAHEHEPLSKSWHLAAQSK